MSLTVEQILALAPDAASAKAGNAQSNLKHWSKLGANEQALWGYCQGSGKDPYRAQIELHTPAFKCTCPSRKFPCKHGLGLYLLFANQPQAFSDNTPPDWVEEWLNGRQKRSEKQAEKLSTQTPEQAAARAKAQQKRQDKREQEVQAGLELLQSWLGDLAREGLAALRGKQQRNWDTIAARMVDAKAAGLAGRIRQAALNLELAPSGWEQNLARDLGQIALLCAAQARAEQLPPALQQDLRTQLGYSQSQEEVLAGNGLPDVWQVLAQTMEQDERLQRRCTYFLGGQSGRWAQVWHFAAPGQQLPAPFVAGATYAGQMFFYPQGQRAIPGEDLQLHSAQAAAPAGQELGTELSMHYAQALAANPFLTTLPCNLRGSMQLDKQVWQLRLPDGSALALDAQFVQQGKAWFVLAVSGGAAVDICGLWDGYSLLPLAMYAENAWYNLDNLSLPASVQNTKSAANAASREPGLQLPPALLQQILAGSARSTAGTVSTPQTGSALLDQHLQRLLNNTDPAQVAPLWLAAAACDNWQRAGQILPQTAALPAANANRRHCPPRAVSSLHAIVHGRFEELLPRWLQLAQEHDASLPPRYLLHLLHLGMQRKTLRAPISALLDQRGQWLLQQHAQWQQYYQADIHSAELKPEQQRAACLQAWEVGDEASRSAALAWLRQHDADEARTLLQTSWGSETVEMRARLLQVLENGLSMADEPLLESTLDDKRKEVRSVAQTLLRRLPASKLVVRCAAWLDAVCKLEKRAFIFTELSLQLPEKISKQEQRDGIGAQRMAQLGEKALWLRDYVASVPPGYWSARWEMSPKQVLQLFAKHEFDLALCLGLVQAVQRALEIAHAAHAAQDQHAMQDALAWYQACLQQLSLDGKKLDAQRDLATAMLAPWALLPGAVQEEWLGKWYAHKQEKNGNAALMLELWSTLQSEQLQTALSLSLSKTWLQQLQAELPAASDNNAYNWQLQTRLQQARFWLSAQEIAYADQGWPDEKWPHWYNWRKAITELQETLRFRHQLEHSFQEKQA